MSGETRAVGTRLRTEWSLVVLVAVGVAVVGTHFVGTTVGERAGRGWLFVVGGIFAFELWVLSRRLPGNDERDGPNRRSLGLANAITLVRGMLYAVAGGFLAVPPVEGVRWAPGLCYGVGAALDSLDGWVARRTGRQSALGAKLDLAFDTLGFLVVPLVGVAWGRLPVWYLAIGAAGYLFRGGVAYRRYRGRYVAPLPPSRVRRPLAAFQMVVVTVALLPVLPTGVTMPLATAAMVPSLLVFARDWFVVSGRLAPGRSRDDSRTPEPETLPGGQGDD